MIDIVVSGGHCQGVIALTSPESLPLAAERRQTLDGRAIVVMEAPEVVWACGGIGGLFEHQTNFPHLTGGCAGDLLAHGIRLRDPDYVQIHPTTLYTGEQAADPS